MTLAATPLPTAQIAPHQSRRAPRDRPGPLERRRRRAGATYVAPAVLLVLFFFVTPLALTVWMSFTDWHLLRGGEVIGTENYERLASDGRFLSALWFTTRFTLITTLATFVLGFLLALLLRHAFRGVSLLRSAYFMPVVVGFATASYVWMWLFHDSVGFVNPFLTWLGILAEPVQWLTNPGTALLTVIVTTVWKTAGFAMLIMLVGLQSVPDELYEAGRVDGATRLQELWYITIPLMRSTFALVAVFLVVQYYLAFDQFFIMTQGGPRNSTITLVYWIFNNAFVGFRLGYGAAMAIALLILLVIINGIQFRLIRKEA